MGLHGGWDGGNKSVTRERPGLDEKINDLQNFPRFWVEICRKSLAITGTTVCELAQCENN